MDKTILDQYFNHVAVGKADSEEQLAKDQELRTRLLKLATIGEKSKLLIKHPTKGLLGGYTCPEDKKNIKAVKYATLEDNQLLFLEHLECLCGYEYCIKTVFKGRVL